MKSKLIKYLFLFAGKLLHKLDKNETGLDDKIADKLIDLSHNLSILDQSASILHNAADVLEDFDSNDTGMDDKIGNWLDSIANKLDALKQE